MLVQDVMTRQVEYVLAEDTIQTAARKMRELDVGSLPVRGDKDQLAGVVTDRDITIRSTADGRDPTRTLVRDAMTEGGICVYADQDVRDAADTMAAHQIRRVLVLDRDERLAGIVALGDLAVDGGSDGMPVTTLKEVSVPAEPRR